MYDLRDALIAMELRNVNTSMISLIQDVMWLDEESGIALAKKIEEITRIVNALKKE